MYQHVDIKSKVAKIMFCKNGVSKRKRLLSMGLFSLAYSLPVVEENKLMIHCWHFMSLGMICEVSEIFSIITLSYKTLLLVGY